MQAAFDIVLFKSGFIKNRIVRQERNRRSGLSCTSNDRQQSIDQFGRWIAVLISILIDIFSVLYTHCQMLRKRIDDGGADTVQTAAGLIGVIVKLTACMQGRENQTLRTDSFFMHPDRDTASVVRNGR